MPEVAEIARCVPWEVRRSYKLAGHEKDTLRNCRQNQRDIGTHARVNGTDSRVCLGDQAKRRFSSYILNGIQRRSLGWHVLGRKHLFNFYLFSSENSSYDPSRDVPFREPYTPSHLDGPLLESAGRAKLLRAQRTHRCKEIFAAHGGLTVALARQGLSVDVAMEAYPEKGKYVLSMDFDRKHVFLGLKHDIEQPLFECVHVGVPRTTWANAGFLNHNTRTKGWEEGSGFLQMRCAMKKLRKLHGVHLYVFDQRQYGLKLPGCRDDVFCRKRTAALTNTSNLSGLQRRCPGISSTHNVCLSPLIICFYEGFIVYEVLFDQSLVYLTTTVRCMFVWQFQFAQRSVIYLFGKCNLPND
jgi:hypothetical protein